MSTGELQDLQVPAQARSGARISTGVYSTFTNNGKVEIYVRNRKASSGHTLRDKDGVNWDSEKGILKPGGTVTMYVDGTGATDENAFGSVEITVQNSAGTSCEVRWESARGKNPKNWTQSKYRASAKGDVLLNMTNYDGNTVLSNLTNSSAEDTTSTETRYDLWSYYNWYVSSDAKPPPEDLPVPGTEIGAKSAFVADFEEGWGDAALQVYSHRITITAKPGEPVKTWEIRFFLSDGLALHKVWLGAAKVVLDPQKRRVVMIRYGEGHLEGGQSLDVDLHLAIPKTEKDDKYKKALVDVKAYRVG
jgi:hypothetical protein